MDIQFLNITADDLVKKIETARKVSIKDYESAEAFFTEQSDESLVPKSNEYPTIHSFSGLDGDNEVNYILESNRNDSKVHDIFQNDVYKVSKQGEEYENDRTLTEIFVLLSAVEWGQDLYFAVYAYYGLKNCIPEPHLSDDIFIWAERQWHKDYRDMPANDYVNRTDSDYNEFETIEAARAYIEKLLTQDYPLAPHEVDRPKYYITY